MRTTLTLEDDAMALARKLSGPDDRATWPDPDQTGGADDAGHRGLRGRAPRRSAVSTVLLDVNVLIALLWPAHEHHEAAHRWFAARGTARWATCPLTEMAFVRIVSNPAFSTDALAPIEALSLLARNLTHPAHEFWPDDVGLVEALGDSVHAELPRFRRKDFKCRSSDSLN